MYIKRLMLTQVKTVCGLARSAIALPETKPTKQGSLRQQMNEDNIRAKFVGIACWLSKRSTVCLFIDANFTVYLFVYNTHTQHTYACMYVLLCIRATLCALCVRVCASVSNGNDISYGNGYR